MTLIEEKVQKLEEEIAAIKDRNRKVEAEKAWETSLFRASIVAVLTYLVMALVMTGIKVENPFISAIVPTLGFVLSTQSIPFIKKWWLKNRYVH